MAFTRGQAKQFRKMLLILADTLSDEEISELPTFVEKWEAGTEYAAGKRVQYNGVVYKVLQDHTSQSDWVPDAAPSLFAQALTSEDGTPSEWIQPDSTNAYMTGDQVIYNGITYESTIDNNVWSPETYPAGWEKVSP